MATRAAAAGADPRRGRWGPQGSARRLLLALLTISILTAIVAPLFVDPIRWDAPKARSGTVDFADWGALERPVPLAGQWQMTWLAGDEGPRAGTQLPIKVPDLWSNQAGPGGRALPLSGAARYELTVRNLPAGQYILHLPPFFMASRVLIDDRPVSSRGRFGLSPDATRYHVRAQNVPFATAGGDVRIAVELAAWLHRDNGMEEAPVLGTAQAMDDWIALKWSREQLYNTSLLLIAALGIAVFLYRQHPSTLYFGLSCIAFIPTTSMLGYDNLLMIQFPGLSFAGMMALQYGSAALAAVLFLANPHSLFPAESARWVFRALTVALLAMAAVQLAFIAVGDTLTASILMNYFLVLAVGVMLYIVGILAVACARRRDGALIFLLGMVLWVLSFLVVLLVATGWVTSDNAVGLEFNAIGVLMLLYSHVILMAERWSLAVAKAEQIAGELRQLVEVNTAITSDLQLEPLLKKIVEVTSRIIHADRSSLFLKHERSGELASLVAEGVGTRQIRFEADSGLAGHVFATGETLNIADAYADPRFNRVVDEATGYLTRSVLTVPIAARDGRRLGVMQALNRIDGKPFDDDDIARMTAFGAQAAIAIDNARLFGEVVAARNFDESILRSMSGGVIALDYAGTVNKLNAAAAEIVGAPIEDLIGIDSWSLVGPKDRWIGEEVMTVARTGEPKLLLDVELTARRERPASVNLSISPLMGEDGPTGVLLVIEDISEGKRLQGAMRRFMTQEVVDQVLGRDDELLFGTACNASVLFADIRGFTTMAEELSARETVEMLNELFTELFEAVAGAGGVLDKYIGDAIMAVYGAPLSSGQDAVNAVASAAEMLRLLDLINARRRERGAPAMRIGIGVASGEVVAGTIGSPKRMDYTVIGDSVNLAARLQELTKTYGVEILVDEATAAVVGDAYDLREIDLIRVRGRQRPAKVFEVLARPPGPACARAALLDAYRDGRAALLAGEWAAASAAFGRAVLLDAADAPSRLMLERARSLAAQPPKRMWDGVWQGPAKVAEEMSVS